MTESRWYASDRFYATAEVEVNYKLFDTNGNLIKTGTILKTSQAEQVTFNKMNSIDKEWSL
jgi:hypothetical protein